MTPLVDYFGRYEDILRDFNTKSLDFVENIGAS